MSTRPPRGRAHPVLFLFAFPRPSGLPGACWWSVAVQDLGLVLVPRRGRPVRVDDQGPAEPVDHDLVVVVAEQDAVFEAGVAAVGFVCGVGDLNAGGGLGASAGPFAVPAAEPDGVADPGRDAVAVADVQGQAGPGKPLLEQPA